MNLLSEHEIRYIESGHKTAIEHGERTRIDVTGHNFAGVYIEIDRMDSVLTVKKTHKHPDDGEFNGEQLAYPDEVQSRSDEVNLYWMFRI